MTEDREIEALLREMEGEEAPLSPMLRTAILADAAAMAAPAPEPGSPWSRFWAGIGGAMAVPACALVGVLLGAAEPDLVLQAVPGLELASAEEVDILDDVFGSDLSWETTE